MLPDHPLYKLKVLRDKIMPYLIKTPAKKIEYDLIMADKLIYSSQLLVDKEKIELAKDAALKGEHYFTILVTDYKWAYWKHQEIPPELDEKIRLSSLKHQEVLNNIIKKVPEKDRKVFQDGINFSKLNYETLVKLKLAKKDK